MAVFTPLSPAEAALVARAHGLGAVSAITPIPAGRVNSNFFLDTDAGRRFMRIYEEQEADGVAYEWALLDHLGEAGLPVPARVAGPAPGAVRVAGKPVALFELVGGEMSCQAGVSKARARALGGFLARCHAAAAGFGWRRRSRFDLGRVAERLAGVPREGELEPVVGRLGAVLAEVREGWPVGLPRGPVHGDLFRDNVHWEGDAIVAAIDWESAADGLFAYDLAVTILAWCFGDAFEWGLAAALVDGYEAIRPLEAREAAELRRMLLAAAARFTVTRITDFHLREGVGERVHKDYRRFLARLEALAAHDAAALAARLGVAVAG